MKKLTIYLLKILPLKIRLCLLFYLKHHYFPNIKSPKYFSEKIQKRKLNLSKADALLADKYAVREYVKNKIGSQYLIPLVGVYEDLNESVLESIPFNTVIKTNHGSGDDHLEFYDENSKNTNVITKFKRALKEDYIGALFGETHYNLIDRKVIVEKKLELNGESLSDFKFHIFKQEKGFDWVLQVDFDRFTDHKRNFYDSKLNSLDYELIYKKGNYSLPKESDLFEMARLAELLLGDKTYARIDFYLIHDSIYFGEITLTPGSGFEKFSSKDIDLQWGNLW